MGLFSRRTPKPAPPQKKFSAPEKIDFDATWKFMLRLMSIDEDYETTDKISIHAEADGSVRLSVDGLGYAMLYLSTTYPAVYQHYQGKKTMCFDFHPDYPVHLWEQSSFEADLRDHAPNGYIDRYKKYPNGTLEVTVRFRDNSFDEYMENRDKLDKLLKYTYCI